MSAPTARLIQGHVLDVLRSLPSESVHCVVTSPPYWGLRAYGTDPQVWGGRADCVHEWGEDLPAKRHRWGNLDTLSEKQASNRGSAANVAALETASGNFCRHCGAWKGELGLEPSLGLFIEHMVEVFREVRRVLRRDGTCWLNMGDCYAGTPNGWDARKYRERGVDDRTFRDKPFATIGNGLKPKDLCLMPARVAIALQEDGWWVRSDIIWHKPNPLPESIEDRPTKSHEYVYLLAKSEEYFYDHEAVKEPATGYRGKSEVGPTNKTDPHGRNGGDGRYKPHTAGRNGNVERQASRQPDRSRAATAFPWAGAPTRSRRTVWKVNTQPYPGAHFATFPEKLVEPCIQAGTSEHGCCGLCGAPYERVTEKGEPNLEWQQACGGDAEGEYHGTAQKAFEGTGAQNASAVKARILEGMRPTITTGWRPTCDCHPLFAGEVQPAVVLDPFNGSGTTGKVALRLGRSYLGIELQPEYLKLAQQRLGLERATP